MKQPDPGRLLAAAGIHTPIIGLYDVPDPAPFAPLIAPAGCIFAAFDAWCEGKTVALSSEEYGCGGGGHWLCGVEARSRQEYVTFLADTEGLKASHVLMEHWLDKVHPLRRSQAYLCAGPLRAEQYGALLTATFWVAPDQLSFLMTGAQYDADTTDPPPVIAPFGSGCLQLGALFDDLSAPQAIIGATDFAMRGHIPAELLAFTVTKPMFERLCALDERSFLTKPFWRRLQAARRRQGIGEDVVD